MHSDSVKAYREVPVVFQNQATKLAGTLCLPHNDAPYPVVVFMHGSGWVQRDGHMIYPQMWEAFAQRGIASLAWDKPGTGQSTGDWRNQSALDRAREGVAAVEFLKNYPEIAADKIGLWGISQAGWIVPLIYSLNPQDVAFKIAVSVPVGGEEQELYRVSRSLPADGYSQSDTERALAFTKLRLEFGHRNIPYETYVELQKLVEHEAWFQDIIFPMGEQEYNGFKRQFQHTEEDIDVPALLEKITCPVLAIFGGLDTIVDTDESKRVYAEAIKKAGNTDFTVKVLAQGDHCIFYSKTGGQREMEEMFKQPVKTFAPEYLATMADWLATRFS